MRRLSGLLFAIGLAPLGRVAKSNFFAGRRQQCPVKRDSSRREWGFRSKTAITVRESETNRTYTAVSNDNGFYVFPNLPPGHYELVAEAAGFANPRRPALSCRSAKLPRWTSP